MTKSVLTLTQNSGFFGTWEWLEDMNSIYNITTLDWLIAFMYPPRLACYSLCAVLPKGGKPEIDKDGRPGTWKITYPKNEATAICHYILR